VILLLAIAVILPTVCLLWFMTQAIENVRMAARQILIDEYSRQIEELSRSLDTVWSKKTGVTQNIADMNATEVFASLVLGEPAVPGVVVYDGSGRLEYPLLDSNRVEPELPEEFEEAWELEFVKKDYDAAWWAYTELAESLNKRAYDILWRKATLGVARCYLKDGDSNKAVAFFSIAGWGRTTARMSAREASLCARARVRFAETFDDPNARVPLGRLAKSAINYSPAHRGFLPMDSATRMFVLSKTIKLCEKSMHASAPEIKLQTNQARTLLRAERLSAVAAQRYPNNALPCQWTVPGLCRIDASVDVYALYSRADNRSFLSLWTGDEVRGQFAGFESKYVGSDVMYEITDNAGVSVFGQESRDDKPFLETTPGKYFPDWKVSLYLENDDIFERAAQKQITLYIWTGVLVAVLMLVAGGFAGQAVSKQVKLNKLKNDFIATVSHELKTPLASMRVLADTLLEGNYKDQQQATEYLELICKENKRLTGLIDNFLTFSRIERNKQVFEMVKTSPSAIVDAAAEAVKARFAGGHCAFDVKAVENLPDVTADRDAMVTVLVNLLDNAYKYSYDDKRIELSVFSKDGYVCFCIRDNGKGISRRSIKKIFKRFYQVDRSLSRRAEGCGLGLNIAKFIVDAHKGTISVVSKPGKGSTFTVMLPVSS